MSRGSRYSSDSLDDFVVLIMAAVVIGLVLAPIWAIVVVGGWLLRLLCSKSSEDEDTEEPPPPPTTLFGEPSSSALHKFYDYALYKLWRVTGIKWSATELGTYIGCLIVTVGLAVLVSRALALVHPLGFVLLKPFSIAGFMFGLYAGYQMTKPAEGWFVFGGRGSGTSGNGRGLFLGEDIDE